MLALAFAKIIHLYINRNDSLGYKIPIFCLYTILWTHFGTVADFGVWEAKRWYGYLLREYTMELLKVYSVHNFLRKPSSVMKTKIGGGV